MKVEIQNHPGNEGRFDYPGMGLRLTTTEGTVIHIHYDIENGIGMSLVNPNTGEWIEGEFEGGTANMAIDASEDVEVKILDVDWKDYWYVNQEWRRPEEGPKNV